MKKILTALIALNLILATLTLNQFLTITYMNSRQYQNNIVKSYLMANYGVSSIDDLIKKKLEEYGLRYTGNPFTTALYPGHLQAENITGMHWYTYISGTLYNRTDTLSYPEQVAKFLVVNASGTIQWKDLSTGQIIEQGTTISEAANIINWALGNLTSGRTWKEKVVLKGNFTISSTINGVSYLILEIQGKLTLASGSNVDLLRFASKNHFEIFGGELDGNKDEQTSTSKGIVFDNCTYFTVKGVYVHDFYSTGMDFLSGCTYVKIVENIVENNGVVGGVGIHPRIKHGIVSRNIAINNYNEGIYVHSGSDNLTVLNNIAIGSRNRNGISLENCGYVRVLNNICNNNTWYGIFTEGDLSQPPIISHNTAIGNGRNGIHVKDDYAEVNDNFVKANGYSGIVIQTSHYSTVNDNIVIANNRNGIVINRSNYTHVSDNTVLNNGQEGGTYYGIAIDYASGVYSFHNFIEGNIVGDNQALPTQSYGIGETNSGCNYNVIKNNKVFGNSVAGIRKLGANTVVKYNEGFVTENDGFTTVANGEYIAHGIDSSLNIGPSNSSVLITEYTKVYDGVPVTVGCDYVNATHIRVAVYWTNGTAITDDAIQVWWRVEY